MFDFLFESVKTRLKKTELKVNLNGVDDLLIDQLTNEINFFKNSYPNVWSKIKEIRMAEFSEISEDEVAHSNVRSNVILLNPIFWSDKNKITSTMNRLHSEKWTVGSKPEHALSHELGHFLGNELTIHNGYILGKCKK